MVRLYVIGLLFTLSVSDMDSQVHVDTEQILGEWVFTEFDRDGKTVSDWPPIQAMFRLEGDSVVYCIQDEYGNYEPEHEMKFHKKPKKSGPNGLLYEWIKNYADHDGDTIQNSYWIKIVDMNKPHVKMTIMKQYGILTTDHLGDYTVWSDRFKEKYRNWCQGCSGFQTTYKGQRVK